MSPDTDHEFPAVQALVAYRACQPVLLLLPALQPCDSPFDR